LPSRPSLLESSRPLEGELSAPEWRYHPRQPAHLARVYAAGAGAQLFVGGLGERWWVDAKSDGPQGAGSSSHYARPAATLAPEALVGLLPAQRQTWIFVGQSGTTYIADSPLGPLLSANAPDQRLARVEAGQKNLLGVGEAGHLMLSEDAGASWHAVGPSGSRFSDVLLAPPYAAALEVPERIWWSDNEGRSWSALDAPPFGAERFERDDEVGPVILSPLGAQQLRLEATPPALSHLGRIARPDEPRLTAPPLEGPNARALLGGRAFVSEGEYFEVELGVRAESLSGKFSGPLSRRKQPELSACQEIGVAGHANWIYAACTRERSGASRQYEFFRSADAGQSFEREAYTARGNPELLRLAVGADGVLIATGLCPPGDAAAGCHARGIQMRGESAGDAGGRAGLEAVSASALEETALALAFSADGRTAYAIGQRTKSDALFVFVAPELARGFAAREISQLETASSAGPRQVRSLAAARDGQLSLVLGQSSGADQLVILDANGRTLSNSSGPMEVAALGAYGNRALAIGPDLVWESLDGGAHWQEVGRPPRSVCTAARNRCGVPVYCQREGCSIGDTLTRMGWQGTVAPAANAAIMPPPVEREGAARRALGTAFACELSEGEWAELSGVDRLPDASQAALGKAAWFALATDDATAAAGLWIADAPPRSEGAPLVRYSELLRASQRAADSAYFATLQVEGAAALRYPIPGGTGASNTRLSRVEVAWENLLEGRRSRGTIADAGNALPSDFAKTAGPARRAQPDLLSIASGGVFARVHRQAEQNQTTYFLDGTSVTEIPPLMGELLPAKGTRSEMARLGAETLGLSFLNQGATVVRAKRQGERWRLDAMTLGFVDLERFSLRQAHEITYAQGRATIHVTTRYADGKSEGYAYPLQAEGAVLGARFAVPTQADLQDDFGCSALQRQSSPRLIAPAHPGQRRPVVVHDPVEPLRVFLSDAAVLFGTPDAACAQAFDTEPVKTSLSPPSARERVLLSADGPSWLFRVSPDNTRRDARIEYRTMKCSVDGGVTIPPEVYDLPGTRIDG
jgi:hypothetical protein